MNTPAISLVHKVLDFAVSQADDSARTFWAVASTGDVDRQGDLIEAAGWDLANFRANPVIPWAHDYAAPPVAKALQVKAEDGRLVFQAQFPTVEEYPFADTIYKLYRGGYLRAFSVGFAPLESEVVTNTVGGRAVTGTRYLRQELYEISCVTLPANPQALVGLSLDGPQNLGLTLKDLHPIPLAEGRSPSPAHGPHDPGAASAPALARAALDCLLKSRLRYHLGLDRH
jgi:HK97 family phage prohead protease